MQSLHLAFLLKHLNRKDSARETQCESNQCAGRQVEASKKMNAGHGESKNEEAKNQYGDRHMEACTGPDLGAQQGIDLEF
jgi:hypothetical protein